MPYLKQKTILVNIVLISVDTILQLAICFICLTMGSHVNLRKFKITLELNQGVARVVLSRYRESLIENEVTFEETIRDELTE
jgi:hypothetical protein